MQNLVKLNILYMLNLFSLITITNIYVRTSDSQKWISKMHLYVKYNRSNFKNS